MGEDTTVEGALVEVAIAVDGRCERKRGEL
jgi:hypothetical protein